MTCSVIWIFLNGYDGEGSECYFIRNQKWKDNKANIKKSQQSKAAKKHQASKWKKKSLRLLAEENMELSIKIKKLESYYVSSPQVQDGYF